MGESGPSHVINENEDDVGAVCERRSKSQETRGQSEDRVFHNECGVMGVEC